MFCVFVFINCIYSTVQDLLRKGDGGRLPPIWAKGDKFPLDQRNCRLARGQIPSTESLFWCCKLDEIVDNHTFTLSSQIEINDAALY